MSFIRVLAAAGIGIFLSTGLWAKGVRDPANLCDAAAQQAAVKWGVPPKVLWAVTRTETGRGAALAPWPWTVNMQGSGKWFKTQQAALEFAKSHHISGVRSFDVGCFQINFRWHGDAFASLSDMFDPVQNADYAARFLKQLYVELGDWSDAAGAFHSRTPKYATRYRARFDKILARYVDPTAKTHDPISRTLVPHSGQGMASLVALSPASRSFLALGSKP